MLIEYILFANAMLIASSFNSHSKHIIRLFLKSVPQCRFISLVFYHQFQSCFPVWQGVWKVCWVGSLLENS